MFLIGKKIQQYSNISFTMQNTETFSPRQRSPITFLIHLLSFFFIPFTFNNFFALFDQSVAKRTKQDMVFCAVYHYTKAFFFAIL